MNIPDGTPTLYELVQYGLNIIYSWILLVKTFWPYILVIFVSIGVFIIILDILRIKFGHEPKEFEND